MSIIDAITNVVEKHPEMNEEQHSNLVQTAMQMFGSHAELSGIEQKAEGQGLGGIVSSWISTGANQPIAPDQVENLVGRDRITQLANRAGIPPAIASAALARILPAVVDRLTPHGKLPQA